MGTRIAWLEVLLVYFELPQHRVQHGLADLGPLDDSRPVSDEQRSVAALALAGDEPEIQPGSLGVTLSAPREFRSVQVYGIPYQMW